MNTLFKYIHIMVSHTHTCTCTNRHRGKGHRHILTLCYEVAWKSLVVSAGIVVSTPKIIFCDLL